MNSCETSSPTIRQFESDAEYIAAQDRESSWSHKSHWGEATANKFVQFGDALEGYGLLYHDDTLADFGGNDGYAAHEFYMAHKIKPLVIDCEPKRLAYASSVFKLPTLRAFIEDLPLADKSIDWGYTSHTMEHMRDPMKAMREMRRVIKRGCLFILPIEGRVHANKNHAHTINFTQPRQWVSILRKCGWKMKYVNRPHGHEMYILAEPKS